MKPKPWGESSSPAVYLPPLTTHFFIIPQPALDSMLPDN